MHVTMPLHASIRSAGQAFLQHWCMLLFAQFGARCAELVCEQSLLHSCLAAVALLSAFLSHWWSIALLASAAIWSALRLLLLLKLVKMPSALAQLALCAGDCLCLFLGRQDQH